MRKFYDEKTFDLGSGYTAECKSQNTNYGWRHVAELYDKDYRIIATSKACYYNRTWERFTYESVLESLIEKAKIDPMYKAIALKMINGEADHEAEEADKGLKMVAQVAKLGEIFGSTQKEKNDWKVRMLKAGLENKGLIMPDDWDSLSEDEKEKRLNGAIGTISK